MKFDIKYIMFLISIVCCYFGGYATANYQFNNKIKDLDNYAKGIGARERMLELQTIDIYNKHYNLLYKESNNIKNKTAQIEQLQIIVNELYKQVQELEKQVN
jgi:archaellum component FlaC